MVDLLQIFLGIAFPPVALSALILLWPALTLRSIFLRFLRALFEENLRGKIVIITGASSSLGQVELPHRYHTKIPSFCPLILNSGQALEVVCTAVFGVLGLASGVRVWKRGSVFLVVKTMLLVFS
jgi:hypothetical protein